MRDLELLVRVRQLASSGEARQLRLAARLSQSEVADVCGTAPSVISRWERNQQRPRGRAAQLYATLIIGLAETHGGARDAA